MRVFLGGRGFPREEFALSGEAAEVSPEVPIILLMEDGDVFHPADYASLGFTNFEAWVVGGSGGRGAGATDRAEFMFNTTREVMPGTFPHGDLWGAWNQQQILYREAYNARLAPEYRDYYGIKPPQIPPYTYPPTYVTQGEYNDYINPTHEFDQRHYTSSKLVPSISGGGQFSGPARNNSLPGGAGGGGGFHKVLGTLEALPDDVPVAVGQAGADAPLGQSKVNGAWNPQPSGLHPIAASLLSSKNWWLTEGRNQIDPEYYYLIDGLIAWFEGYPSLPDVFYPPQPGSDGEASSFGDIAKASGGKGGKPTVKWAGSVLVSDGGGGDGGIGNSLVAGGGGVGGTGGVSFTQSVLKGKDGLWDGVAVGAGGGGGGTYGGGFWAPGGRGSFSYSDISVLAPGDEADGDGGSARIIGNRKFGSGAKGYSPNGVVLLRLYRTG